MSKIEPVRYGVFKEMFEIFGINPYLFGVISGDNVAGYYPNIRKREPKISVDRLAAVLWEE